MFVNEVQQEIHKGPVAVTPKWMRIKDAARYAGLSRSLLYEILASGEIKSFALKSAGAIRGVRLVSVESIDAFITRKAGEAEEGVTQ
jgi:hypothetical protein